MIYQDLLFLSEKTVRSFNHYVFISMCEEFDVIPVGLQVKKQPCIGKVSNQSSSEWKDSLTSCSLKLISILQKEHKIKWKQYELLFWNKLQSYFEEPEENHVKGIEGILRSINSLMWELRKIRIQKLFLNYLV